MQPDYQDFPITSVNDIISDDVRLLSAPTVEYNEEGSLSVAKQLYQQHGFLVVRNFLNRLKIDRLLDLVRSQLQKMGQKSFCLSGYEPITSSQEFQSILRDTADSKLFGQLFGQASCKPITTKYLMGLSQKQGIPLHCDYYRLKTHPMFTTWIPLTPMDMKSGTLVFDRRYSTQQLHRQAKNSELPEAFLEQHGDRVFHYSKLREGDLVLLDINMVYGTFRYLNGAIEEMIVEVSVYIQILNGLHIHLNFNLQLSDRYKQAGKQPNLIQLSQGGGSRRSHQSKISLLLLILNSHFGTNFQF